LKDKSAGSKSKHTKSKLLKPDDQQAELYQFSLYIKTFLTRIVTFGEGFAVKQIF